jgi:putative MFS transporter
LLTLKNPFYIVTAVGCLYIVMALALALLGPSVRGKTLEVLESGVE